MTELTKPEPHRPEPAASGFSGDDWSSYDEPTFKQKEAELREKLRSNHDHDFFTR
jgi:hypothetical protein